MKNKFEVRGNLVAIFLKRRDKSVIETVIDIGDLPKVQAFRGSWYAHWNKDIQSFYVAANVFEDGKRTITRLHRWLMDTPKGLVVDHKNHETLKNTRENMRNVTETVNMQNQRLKKTNVSGFRGITWSRQRNKWVAQIGVNGKTTHLGRFTELAEAIAVTSQARSQFMPGCIY